MTLRSNDADVNKPKAHQWLKSTSLEVKTGTFIISVQDQRLFTGNWQENIIKIDADSICRLYIQYYYLFVRS